MSLSINMHRKDNGSVCSSIRSDQSYIFRVVALDKTNILAVCISWGKAFDIKCSKLCVSSGSGSVVECLTRDRRAAGLSLTGVTTLCP